MAPLNIVRPRVLEHIPRGRETVHLSEKLVSFIAGKSDECRSSIIQARAIVVGEERSKRTGLAVPIRADHHKG